ncbi:MAG TPA: hypothetical protein VLI46_06270 [Ramlibacter sp.]|nr:hypothetical protein [Ramlibacter sp.]
MKPLCRSSIVSHSSNSAVTLRLSTRGFGFDAGGALAAMQPWPAGRDVKAVVAALAELPLQAQPGKKLSVILDNAWTRFQLVRFPAQVNTPEERQVFLQAHFRRVFGAEAQDWTIIAEPAYFGLPVMAVAVDHMLIAALSRLAERHQLRLRSLQPEFVEAFNRVRPMLSGGQGAFAQIGGDRVCMALWRGPCWEAVRSQPLAPGARGSMAALLAQMLANVNPPMTSGTLHLADSDNRPGQGGQPLPEALTTGWTAKRLPVHTP